MKIAANAPVGIVGGGTMGRGIAALAAAAEHPVSVYDADSAVAEKAIKAAQASLARRAAKGKLKNADDAVARLRPAGSIQELADCAVVIEAAVENEEIKREIFSRLDSVCAPAAILASNTSSLSIARLAAGLRHPERVAGMHFFNPPTAMKLVEIVQAQTTSAEVANALADLAARWGKTAIIVANTPGFVANRVARPFYGEALRMLEEGIADVRCIDDCLTAAGFPMGPFALMDLIGNDVNLATSESVFRGLYYDSRFRPSPLQREMVDANLLGRKTGAGFYDYKTDPPTARDFGVKTYCFPNTEWQAAKVQDEITVLGDGGGLATLATAAKRRGFLVKKGNNGINGLCCGEALIVASGGKSARDVMTKTNFPGVVVVDWNDNQPNAHAVAITRVFDEFTTLDNRYNPGSVPNASSDALNAVLLLHAAGVKNVYTVADAPGLVVSRTMAMLANAAADATFLLLGALGAEERIFDIHRGSNAREISAAMRAGFNFPDRVLEWSDRAVETLKGLAAFYGEERYRVSPYFINYR